MTEPVTYPCDLGRPPNAQRARELVANTSTPDRHKTVYPPRNGRFANFQRNPAVTWMHAELQGEKRTVDPDELIGLAPYLRIEPGEDPSESDRLVFGVEFEEGNALAQRCLEKFDAGVLRAASITAIPKRTHDEGSITVADEWELVAISLCVVGSNPDALAVRAFIEGRTMNPELMKELGCEDGATFEQCLKALIEKLADTPEKQALAMAVMGMKAFGGPPSESSAPAAEASAAPADAAAGSEMPAATDPEAKAASEGCEMRAANLVISALRAENTALRSAQAPKQTAEQFADSQIRAGNWPAQSRAALIKEFGVSPEAAQRAVALMSGTSFAPHQGSLSSLAPGLASARSAAPNLGPGKPRVDDPEDDAKEQAKRDAQNIRHQANRRIAQQTGATFGKE